MTRAKRRNEKKKYEKDFAFFCQIMKRYFPDFSDWHANLNEKHLLYQQHTADDGYPRKGRVNQKLHMEWVPEIDYRGCNLMLLAPKIKESTEKGWKEKTLTFQGLTDLTVMLFNAAKFEDAARKR